MAKQPSINNASLFRDMLLQRRRSMGEANRRKTTKPKQQVWLYPFSVEREYAKKITKWIKPLIDRTMLEIQGQLLTWIQDYNQRIGKLDSIRMDAYPEGLSATIDQLESLAKRAADDDLKMMITNVGYNTSDQNFKQWSKFTEGVLGVKFFPTEPWEIETVKAWGQTNFNLIKSMSDEYIKKTNLIVSEGVQSGKTYDEIMRNLRKTNKSISGTKARLIARDQVGKLTEQFSQRRQTDAGISMYTWATVGDERVRSSHKSMDNKLCRWDDPTVYSEDGGKTWKSRSSIGGVQLHPGQDIQCRCTAIAYFNDVIEEADSTIKEES